MERRKFLTAVGSTISGMAIAGCQESEQEKVPKHDDTPNVEPNNGEDDDKEKKSRPSKDQYSLNSFTT